jgi:U3 small nucleolar RNA-associated protein 13
VQGVTNEAVVAFVASPTSHTLVTFGRNLSVRVWNWETGASLNSWKGHRLPALCCDAEPTGTLVASGGSDKMVFVWDVDHGHATHSFRGHEAIVTCVKFLPHPHSVERLASGGDDGKVRIWDLVSQSCVAILSEHYSTVTAILFSPEPSGYTMVTGGRDKVLSIWDTRDFNTGAGAAAVAPRSTLTVLEAIEGAVTLPVEAAPEAYRGVDGSSAGAARGKETVFVTAGDQGKLRKWRLAVSGETRADRTYTCQCLQSTNVHNLRQGLEAAVGSTATASADGASAAAAGAEPPVSHQFGGLLLRKRARPAATAVAVADAGASGPAATTGSKRKRPADEVTGSGSAATDGGSVELLAVTRDHVLTLVASAQLAARKTIVGYNDEILDLKYIPNNPFAASAASAAAAAGRPGATPEFVPRVAMATNSEQLRLMDLGNFSARLCDGHAGIILNVSVSPDGSLVASASKDATARVWDVATGHCLAVCEGHTESVTAVAWPTRAANFMRATVAAGAESGSASGADSSATAVVGAHGWLLSGSKDRTLKLWQLSSLLSQLQSPRPAGWADRTDKLLTGPALRPRTGAAIVAHDKDINSISVAPNDRLAATGSQDKTIKLWSLPELTLVATLRGHKRGVWNVCFSPTDQVLASASGDRTVRLWAVTAAAGFACLRSFEGHDASALNVRFLRRGTQLLSTGADGLVKLWNVRSGEIMNTFDAHTQKIWSLAVRPADLPLEGSTAAALAAGTGAPGGSDAEAAAAAPVEGEGDWELEMVTGGGDSVLNVWRDVTSSEAEDAVAAGEEALAKQQTLMTAMALRNYHQAVALTLDLDQPRRCCEILQELLERGPLPVTVTLTPSQKDALYRDDVLAELSELHGIDDPAAAAPFDSAAAAFGGGGSAAAARGAAKKAQVAHAEGEAKLVQVLRQLNFLHLGRLLLYMREWNTQSRNGTLAQQLLYLTLRYLPRRALLGACRAILALQGQGALKVIPGVGSVMSRADAGALSMLSSLAPVVDPGDAYGEATASMLAASAGGASAKAAAAATTAAAADLLRSFVAAMVPYGERHHDRLDRLLVSSYAVDYTLSAMQVLQPSADDLASLGLDADGTLVRAAGRQGAARSEFASDDEESSDEDSDGEDA